MSQYLDLILDENDNTKKIYVDKLKIPFIDEEVSNIKVENQIDRNHPKFRYHKGNNFA